MQLAPVQVILLSLPQPSAREKTRGISRRIFIGNDSSPRIRQRPCELRRTGERRSDGEGSTRRSPLLQMADASNAQRFLRLLARLIEIISSHAQYGALAGGAYAINRSTRLFWIGALLLFASSG